MEGEQRTHRERVARAFLAAGFGEPCKTDEEIARLVDRTKRRLLNVEGKDS